MRSPARTRSSGGSLAGAKSFTATSGPGFSLMQEAIGYAHKIGIPARDRERPARRSRHRHADDARPGRSACRPATARTGDYTSFVFYPSTVAECYEYTIQAFNAAEESRSPVILLSDAFLGHLNEVVDLDEIRRAGRAAHHRAARNRQHPVVLRSGHVPRRRAGHRRRRRVHPPVRARTATIAARWPRSTRSTSTAGTRTRTRS